MPLPTSGALVRSPHPMNVRGDLLQHFATVADSSRLVTCQSEPVLANSPVTRLQRAFGILGHFGPRASHSTDLSALLCRHLRLQLFGCLRSNTCPIMPTPALAGHALRLHQAWPRALLAADLIAAGGLP